VLLWRGATSHGGRFFAKKSWRKEGEAPLLGYKGPGSKPPRAPIARIAWVASESDNPYDDVQVCGARGRTEKGGRRRTHEERLETEFTRLSFRIKRYMRKGSEISYQKGGGEDLNRLKKHLEC